MRKILFCFVTSALLAGCQSSGVLPAGPNTYTVTEVIPPIAGGGAEAQKKALLEADAYCKNQTRVFVPDAMNRAGDMNNPMGPTGYTIVFRCLMANDPDVAAFRLQKAPDAIIETRDR